MGGPLFLRASAGSGKTYRLTLEYLRILLKRPEHFRSILAITFTNDATAEMKSRIQEELKKLAHGNPGSMAAHLSEIGTPDLLAQRAQEALRLILHDYTHFSVMTIDGFFQMVLRSFSRELQLPMGYAVELDQDNVLQYAIQSMLADIGKEPSLTNWLVEYAKSNLEEGKTWNIEKQTAEVAEELFKEISQHREWENTELLGDTMSRFRQELWKLTRSFDERMGALGVKALELTDRFGITKEDVNRGTLVNFFHKIQQGIYDSGSTVNDILSGEATIWKKSATPDTINKIQSCLDAGLQEILDRIAHMLDTEIEAYNSARVALRHLYNLGILGWLQKYIRQYRNEENALLISDTLALLGSLVCNENTPFIYEKIGTRYRHILIDEFQDTSTQQWNNLLPLILNLLGEGGKVLVVGDAKQSIYRWRGGDMRLILEKAPADLAHFNPIQESLDTNYRSRENIVRFNNNLFSWISDVSEAHTGGRVAQVYEGAAQHALQQPGKQGGYVSLRFISADEEGNSIAVQTMDHLVGIIEDALARGYRGADIGILVRNNVLAETVANHLVQHRIDVVTPQSLMLAGDERVRLLLAALRLIAQPTATLYETEVLQKYIITQGYNDISDEDIFLRKYEDDRLALVCSFLQEIPLLATLPLHEINEWLIRHLLPGAKADAFLLAWQDTIGAFTWEGSARLQAFLEWWDEKGHTSTVQVPESPGAVKLMTIHKSKGLQFPVVILPSVKWELRPNHRQLLWVNADERPYNTVPFIPVNCSSKLQQTYFAPDYEEECLATLVDSINMLYVACTRAADELYMMCPGETKENDDPSTFSHVSQYFQYGVRQGELAGLKEVSEDTLELGEKTLPAIVDAKEGVPLLPDYISIPLEGKLSLRTFSGEEAIQKGITWHRLLADITHPGQVAPVVEAFMAREVPAELSAEDVAAKVRDILALEAKYVPDTYHTIMSERDLLWNGEIIRPDKICLDGKQCIIIDYKTGLEDSKHLTQMRKYRQALSDCGYTVAGAWLVYTDRLEVVAIDG